MNAIPTDDLIRRLARDPLPPAGPSLEARLRIAAVAGAASAAAAVLALFGVRADLGAVIFTAPIALKFVLGTAVAVAAFRMTLRLARPGAGALCRLSVAVLGIAAALCLAAFVSLASGRAAIPPLAVFEVCSASIALLGLLPLVLALSALRVGAATCPGLAGAAAGVLAGAIAVVAYAVVCPLDDPQMVVLAYTAGVAVLSVGGVAVGRTVLAW
jgi:hypothetical protein